MLLQMMMYETNRLIYTVNRGRVTHASAEQQRCASVNLTDMSCTRAALTDLCEKIKLLTQQNAELLRSVSKLVSSVKSFDKIDDQDSAADHEEEAKTFPKVESF